jgi:hypothetical protein
MGMIHHLLVHGVLRVLDSGGLMGAGIVMQHDDGGMKVIEDSTLVLCVDGHANVLLCVGTWELNDTLLVLFGPILHLDGWH